jgi:hypothetical protein
LQKIHEERANLTARITQNAEMVNALNEVSAREELRYLKENRKLPAPIFTEQEMKELSAHADRHRDPQFYKTLIELDRQHDARAFRGLPILPVERVERAMAREVMAGIAVCEGQARLQKFTDQREKVMVMVMDDKSQGIGLARIAMSSRALRLNISLKVELNRPTRSGQCFRNWIRGGRPEPWHTFRRAY